MYFRVQQEQWQNVKHFNITADPGTHNGKSVFAALAYTWETNMGTVGAWQHIVTGKKILPDESQHYRYILSLKKRARVASLRQLQAASHVLSQLSKGQLTIGEFNVPGLCLICGARISSGSCHLHFEWVDGKAWTMPFPVAAPRQPSAVAQCLSRRD